MKKVKKKKKWRRKGEAIKRCRLALNYHLFILSDRIELCSGYKLEISSFLSVVQLNSFYIIKDFIPHLVEL